MIAPFFYKEVDRSSIKQKGSLFRLGLGPVELVDLLNEEWTRGRADHAASPALQACNVLPHLGWEDEHLLLVVVPERFGEAHAGLALECILVDVFQRVCRLLKRAFYHASLPSEGGVHPSSLVLIETVIRPLFNSLLQSQVKWVRNMVIQHFLPRSLLPLLFLLRPGLPHGLPGVLRLRSSIHSRQDITLLSSFGPLHPLIMLLMLTMDGDSALYGGRDGLILHDLILEYDFAGRVVLRRGENAAIVDECLVLDQFPLDVVPFFVVLCPQLVHAIKNYQAGPVDGK